MISTAIQKGNWVHVYDEKNRQISSYNGELHGFTSTTVSIKKGNWIEVYDEKGHKISSHCTR